jgi:hypothetical protein
MGESWEGMREHAWMIGWEFGRCSSCRVVNRPSIQCTHPLLHINQPTPVQAKHYAFDYRPASAAASSGQAAATKRYVWDAAQAKATLRRAGAQAEALDARRALELHELGEDYTRALALLNRQLCLVSGLVSG